jgi:hypothetical protein
MIELEKETEDEREEYKKMSGVITEDLLRKYATPKTNIEEFYTKIVGTTFKNKEELDEVDDGDYALLDPEVDNKYDEFAVRVIHDKTGNHIGYISKEMNEKIWKNAIYNGDLYLARITITGNTEEKQRGFNINVRHLSVPIE